MDKRKERQLTMLQEIYEELFADFKNKLKNEQKNVPYNFNILDEQEGHIVENSHTNILMKILQYKNRYQNKYCFLESFFNFLNIPILINKSDVAFRREKYSKGGEKNGRIDGLIYQIDNFALIIENKVNHAGPTEKQIETYIKGIKKEYNFEPDKIWIIYLTENGIDKPQKKDVDFLIKNGFCSEESKNDDYSDIQGERYFAVNYRDDILPWLKNEIQPTVMQREQVLNTGLIQYIDFLEGMLGMRKQDIDLMPKCKVELDKLLLDKIPEIKNCGLKDRNQILSEIYSFSIDKINNLENNEKAQEDYHAAIIFKNLIEQINEDSMKLFFDITREYFVNNGMKECVIHPVFNFNYIQIRDASWPRSIHFEWYPFRNALFGNKTEYTFCFHVETKKEFWDSYKNLFGNSSHYELCEKCRTLEHKKTIKFEKSILEMLDDKNKLKDFLEKAYAEITPELIKNINERIKTGPKNSIVR